MYKMGEYDIQQTSTTDMDSNVDDYQVTPVILDTASVSGEAHYDNPDYTKNLGYYTEHGGYGASLNAFATWVIGRGFIADNRTMANLENINGWGEDTFTSIMWNMIVVKKLQGDSFSQIIRNPDTGTLINLRPKGNLRIVVNAENRIIRYEEIEDRKVKNKFKPSEILHLCNNRIGNQIHGTSTTKRVEWAIKARREAMEDWKRISHRSTVRVLYVEENDKARHSQLKSDYADAINNGDVMLMPGKPGDNAFQDLELPPVQNFLEWIKYTEDSYYKELGMPKIIMGGTADNTEASAKVGVIVFDPIFIRELVELERDLWNQVGIKININKQPSLMDNVQTQEGKNEAQTGFQPQDAQAPTL
jgi:hypothetical protein